MLITFSKHFLRLKRDNTSSVINVKKGQYIIILNILLLFSNLCTFWSFINVYYTRSSKKFLSFYKEIMDAQHFLSYIILSNYVWSILFYQNKDHNIWQIRFHVCIVEENIRLVWSLVLHAKLVRLPTTLLCLWCRPRVNYLSVFSVFIRLYMVVKFRKRENWICMNQ